MDIPGHLRRWRRYRGLSQQALASEVGYDQTTVCNWERGKSPNGIKSAILERLAHFYGFENMAHWLATPPPKFEE